MQTQPKSTQPTSSSSIQSQPSAAAQHPLPSPSPLAYYPPGQIYQPPPQPLPYLPSQQPQGQFVITEPYITGAGQYVQFPGPRPYSACRGLQAPDCESKWRPGQPPCHPCKPPCQWISDVAGREYCRGQSGSVSSTIPPGASVRYVPAYTLGFSECARLYEQDCVVQPGCTWIEDSLRRHYCRGPAGSTLPLTSALQRGGQPLPSTIPFTATGRFEPRYYSAEQKETWYAANAPLDYADRKFCRCIAEEGAADLLRHGEFATNPYAICNATISRAYDVSGSELAAVSRQGECTTYADFQQWPTELLYEHAKLREHTSKGSRYFSNLPTVPDFLQQPEAWRPYLLQQIAAYQEDERRTKPYYPVRMEMGYQQQPLPQSPEPTQFVHFFPSASK